MRLRNPRNARALSPRIILRRRPPMAAAFSRSSMAPVRGPQPPPATMGRPQTGRRQSVVTTTGCRAAVTMQLYRLGTYPKSEPNVETERARQTPYETAPCGASSTPLRLRSAQWPRRWTSGGASGFYECRQADADGARSTSAVGYPRALFARQPARPGAIRDLRGGRIAPSRS